MRIDDFLQQFSKEHIYFLPNPGNGGDAFIALAAIEIFKRNNITFTLITTDDHAQVLPELKGKTVFFGGGGNFVEYYDGCASFIKAHHQLVKKLVVLPHTISGHADLLSSLGANVEILCREQRSFEYVRQFSNIGRVLLLRDLAFELDVKNVLQIPYPRENVRKYILKIMVKKILRGKLDFSTLNAFRKDAERTNIELAYDNQDVSAIVYDWKMRSIEAISQNTGHIFQILNGFKIIKTNRLHIAIAGALLGKEVYFYPNAYWKNEEIFEYSIKDKFANVKWMGSTSQS